MSAQGSKPPSTATTSMMPGPESLFSRLIVAPVLFVSFLVSLFLIDRQTYGSVFSSQNKHHSDTGARPQSPESHGATEDHDGYWHENKRKLARQEMEDAFQLRSKVIAGFVMLGGVSVAVVGWGGSRAFGALSRL